MSFKKVQVIEPKRRRGGSRISATTGLLNQIQEVDNMRETRGNTLGQGYFT